MLSQLRNFSFFLLFIAPLAGFSQAGFNYAGITHSLPSQRYQPANLGSRDEKFGVAVDAGAWVANSGFTLKGVFAENGYLTAETRERMVKTAGKNFAMNAGYKLGILNVNYNFGNVNGSVFIEQQYGASAQFGNANTLGLILFGNRRYEGQTVSDDKVHFVYNGVRAYGVGAGINRDRLRAGVRLKFLQGFAYGELKKTSYSLATAQDGLSLTISANYNLAISNQGKSGLLSGKGLGAALDAGVSFDLNDDITLDASVLDAGFLTWRKVDKMQHEANNVYFEGINIASLFDANLDTTIQEAVDSLKGLLLPDTVVANQTGLYGPTIRAGAMIKLGEKNTLYPQIVWIPFSANGFTRLPVLNVTYQRKLGKVFSAGANVYGGGTDLYGVGLMGGMHLEFAGAYAIQFQIMADNVLGLLIPSIGKGFSLQAGLGFDILGE